MNHEVASIQTFHYQSELLVRTISIDGEPWFVAKDLCDALGYANSRKALADHCHGRGVTKRDTPTSSGVQHLTYVSEGNMFRLCIKSHKPEARKFEAWVCDEVLPSIRKTGVYIHEAHPNVRAAAAQADLFTQPATAPDLTGATPISELVLLRQLYATQTRLVELLESKLKPKTKKPANRPLTPEEIATARSMKAAGVNNSAISRHLKRSTGCISLICRDLH